MPKFFIDSANIHGQTAKIYGSDVRHISKVLRLKTESVVILCDGEGYDYIARLCKIDPEYIMVDILEKKRCTAEPTLKVTLFQGIPKSGKMEYIIEKCTELGISSIVPVTTHRTVVRFDDGESKQKKVERWKKIASESIKQCARGAVPSICDVYDISEVKGLVDCLDLCLVAYEKETATTLKSLLKENKDVSSIGIFVGPEGGFEEEEIEFLKSLGVKSFTLGSRILRTETAGQAVLSTIMYEFDELQ